MTDRARSEPPSPLTVLEMIHGGWMSQALYVAARLEIADHLADGPRRSKELAGAIAVHPDSLYRLLRALATLGLCSERGDDVFELTPLGNYLRASVAGSVRASALHWGGSLWPVWATLLHSVRTGESLRGAIARKTGFESLAQQPEAARIFNEAMVEVTSLLVEAVLRGCDFSGIERIVDVGGGYGELLVAILQAHPTTRGVLFDLPHVVEGARRNIGRAGVAERCEVVAGSFFDSIPRGGDACLLKAVLHDWNDDCGVEILKNCRRAMDGHGKLLVVERLLPERMQPSAEHRWTAASDLNMLVTLAGRERTAAGYRALFDAAGFELTRIAPAAAAFYVIEATC